MIDLNDLYDGMTETQTMTQESKELLDKLLSLSSPMKFSTDFAMNEQLDRLEQELENVVHLHPKVQEMIYTVLELRAIASSKVVFI